MNYKEHERKMREEQQAYEVQKLLNEVDEEIGKIENIHQAVESENMEIVDYEIQHKSFFGEVCIGIYESLSLENT
jgi:hypothetical protein